MIIGFSTGSLALGDFHKGLALVAGKNVNAIELSALRESEFTNLLGSLDSLDLSQFEYISFHAPSKLKLFSEEEIVRLLQSVTERKWPIIVHPDIIHKYPLWHGLGKYLCIENMDKRKNVGSTSNDLKQLFLNLPEASLCLDLAHVKQIDPTMTEAFEMITQFNERIMQIHISDVNSNSVHEPLNYGAILAFKKVSNDIPSNIPIIIESPVSSENIENEVNLTQSIFSTQDIYSEIK